MDEIEILRRYTTLPGVLHILRNKTLTLLNPEYWDDRNDAYFVTQYKEFIGAKSTLALCFAQQRETYHHWRIFSGSDGVCIEFNKAKLLACLAKDPTIQAREVAYKQVSEISGTRIPPEDLPFLKRFPYEDEREFRLLYVNMDEESDFHNVRISLWSILRITLSPWMARPLVDTVKATLKQIEGCERMRIYQSTLIENNKWKKAANPDLEIDG